MNVELSSCVVIQSGHPFRGSVVADSQGNAYALQMRDITPDGVISWTELTLTRVERHSKAVWLRAGDIVFVARGTRNYALCLDDVPLPAVCSPHCFLLRTRSAAVVPEFVAWQINRAPAQRYFAKHALGSDQLSIRRSVLGSLPIFIPSLLQQERIVALARATLRQKKLLEALIRNREYQLDALAFDLPAELTLTR